MAIRNLHFHNIEAKRRVLYRNFHNVSGVIYLVEISRTPKRVYVILFPNFEKPDVFIQDSLPEKMF